MPRINTKDMTTNKFSTALAWMLPDQIDKTITNLDKDGLFFDQNKSTMNSAELTEFQDGIMHHKDEILEALSNDMPYFDDKIEQESLNKILTTIDPDYQPPSNEQLEQIQQKQTAFRKTVVAASAKKSLTQKMCNAPMDKNDPEYLPMLDRTDSLLYYTDLTDESLEKNREIRKIMTTGTPTQKRDLIMQRLKEFSEMAPIVDATDTDTVMENAEQLVPLSLVAPEFINLVQKANNLGVDFTTGPNAELNKKIAKLSYIGDEMRMQVDIIGGPLFSQADLKSFDVGKSDFFNNPICISRDNQQVYRGNEIFEKVETPEEAAQNEGMDFVERLDENESNLDTYHLRRCDTTGDVAEGIYPGFEQKVPGIDNALRQTELEHRERMSEENPMLNNALTMEEREREFDNFFKNSPKSVFNNVGKPTVFINEAGELQDINPQPKVQPNPDEVKETLSPLEQRKQRILANVEKIQKVIPDFKFDDNDMNQMLSEERNQCFDKMTAVKQEIDTKRGIIKNAFYENTPMMFKRISCNLFTNGNSPEASVNRENILKNLNAPTTEGHQLRKETLLKALNVVNSLDAEQFSDKHSVSEQVQYVTENIDTLMIAHDAKNMVKGIKDSNLKLSDKANEDFEERFRWEYRVGTMGAVLYNTFSNPNLKDFPFEKLNSAQVHTLMTCQDEDMIKLGSASVGFVDDAEEKKAGVPENKPIEFDEDSIEDTPAAELSTVNDLNELGVKLATEYKKLKDADHALNFNNSKEYKGMLKGLEQAGKVLKEIKNGVIDGDKKERLFNALQTIRTNAFQYKREKQALLDSGESFNKNRQTRFDSANNLTVLTGVLVQNKANNKMENDGVFNTFVNHHNRSVEEDTVFRSRTETFEKGVKETNRIITELNNGKKKSAGEVFVTQQLLNCRESLMNMVGKTDIPQTEAKEKMMMMVFCQNKLREGNIPDNITAQDFVREFRQQSIARRKEFKREVDSDKINSFLADGFDKTISERMENEVLEPAIKMQNAECAERLRQLKSNEQKANSNETQLTELMLKAREDLTRIACGTNINQNNVKRDFSIIMFCNEKMNQKNPQPQQDSKTIAEEWKQWDAANRSKIRQEFTHQDIKRNLADNGNALAEKLNPEKTVENKNPSLGAM